jgi:hypothetical protein
MPYSPRNVRIACNHAGLTHYGGVYFFHEFLRVLQRKIPTASFAANALYLEIVRLAYNLVTAFQRNCLDEAWQNLTLQKLRYKLFLIPGELTRPQNRPVLRLRPSPMIQSLGETILARATKLKPLQP